MSVYRRGKMYWYKFWFANKLIRESAKTSSKTLAKEAEKKRRRELEAGYNNLSQDFRNQRVLTLRQAADKYSADYTIRYPSSSVKYQKYCVKHLVDHLGDKMLIEITDKVVQAYQVARLREGSAGKTINEEVGELLRIMGDVGGVVRLKLRKERKLKLTQRTDCGKALTSEEEARLLAAAKHAKSPVIYPAIVLGLNTTMRDAEMRHLNWKQIDFFKQIITVGKSKTEASTGRTIPMNSALIHVLAEYQAWYEANVGPALPENFVFPFGKARKYNPAKPMTTLKTAWNNARKKAGVTVRLHDLRHTVITKLAESGAGDETIMAIAGHVSRKMLSRYAHIRTEAKRRALEAVATKPITIPEAQAIAEQVTIQ